MLNKEAPQKTTTATTATDDEDEEYDIPDEIEEVIGKTWKNDYKSFDSILLCCSQNLANISSLKLFFKL